MTVSVWDRKASGEKWQRGNALNQESHKSWVAGFWVLNVLSSSGLPGNVLREDRVSLIGIGKIGPSQRDA